MDTIRDKTPYKNKGVLLSKYTFLECLPPYVFYEVFHYESSLNCYEGITIYVSIEVRIPCQLNKEMSGINAEE